MFKSILVIISLLSLGACAHKQYGKMKFADGQVQHVVRGKEIQWKKCPPNLPSSCEIFILDGSPKKKDLFTVIKL